jgi:DNA-directed RNA polymerase specialized sigma24 family protein
LERLSREQVPTAIADAQSEERRELNRSIWCITQRWRRAPRLYSLDPASPAQPVAASPRDESEWDEVAETAAECLTEQQRKIVGMYVQGWSINEIASELSLTPARASDEKYKAVQKLRRTLGKVG